jgi:signal peptidase I
LKFNKAEKYAHRSKIVQLAAEFYPVLLLVFLLRGFIVEPFRIPSNSMFTPLIIRVPKHHDITTLWVTNIHQLSV